MSSTSIHSPDSAGPRPAVGISRDEIQDRLDDRALVLVNVLPRDVFGAARIPGSISLPVSEIDKRAREILPRLSQEIAVYCATPT